MHSAKGLSENVRRLRFMAAQQQTHPAAAAAATVAAKWKKEDWYAPGWELAERIYEQQQQQQQQQQQEASITAPQYDLLLVRRSFGGMNPFIESVNKKQLKKAAAAAALREEREQALLLARNREGRQLPPGLHA
ncbi:hypothetical protein Efla_007372 [Eimeria flavescens]